MLNRILGSSHLACEFFGLRKHLGTSLFLCALFAISLSACTDRKPFFQTGGATSAGRVAPEEFAKQPGASSPLPDDHVRRDRPDRKPIVWRGSGDVLASVQPAEESVVKLPGDRVSLNFVKAGLPEVIQAVVGDILGISYVIDPSVQGEVTIETARPIARRDLMSVLETVLQMNGATFVMSGDFLKVVKLESAAGIGPPLATGSVSDTAIPGFRLQIVPLRYVAAEDVKTVLEPLLGPASKLRIDPIRNIVVLAGPHSDLQSLIEAIQVFDVDWMAGMSFGIFPATYADASKLAEEVRALFGETFGLNLSAMMHIASIQRLNAVMIVARNKEHLDRAAALISRLDTNWNQNERRIYVYKVRNAKASDLAGILQEIFNASGSTVSRTYRDDTVAPSMQPIDIGRRSKNVTNLGRSLENQSGNGTSTESPSDRVSLGEEGSFAGSSEFTSTKNGAAAGIARFRSSQSTVNLEGSTSATEFKIIADEFNNALVVLATPAEYRMVEFALQSLDIEPLQVLIEATIAEVLLNDDLRYGVEWFLREGNSQFNLSTISSTALPQLSSSGFSYLYETANAAAALDVLSEVSDVKVISSPQLMVLGNQTASLQVGDQVPILTRTATSVIDPDSPTVNEIEYRDTGIILTVTPRVNPGGLVTMEIEQEASSVAETTTGAAESPTIQQRRISSTVAVQSGYSVALGGLIRDDSTKSRTGIPILSDIPILGALFSRTADLIGRTELIVILTPRVIGSSKQAVAVASEMRERMKGLKELKLWGPGKLDNPQKENVQP